jgi:hypothetical protein
MSLSICLEKLILVFFSSGHGMGGLLAGGAAAAAAAYGAHQLGHGGSHYPQGSHMNHGKFKHHGGGKFKHGKFGKHGGMYQEVEVIPFMWVNSVLLTL